tara:strand:- start:379 stop:612 length:234 start_codon:yes stop_codon:yes gene_type:complete
VGNSAVLKETALIEAFNLKAAIEFQMKNYDAAREALSDMPPRGDPNPNPNPNPQPDPNPNPNPNPIPSPNPKPNMPP